MSASSGRPVSCPTRCLLLEHPPVYTRGRRSGRGGAAAWPRTSIARHGIDLVDDRPWWARHLPRPGPARRLSRSCASPTSARTCARWKPRSSRRSPCEGIEARSRSDEGPDYTGVWVEDRKIASIGVHVSRGISTHGFAVNVENDLDPFSWVVACGLPDVAMTSVARELGARTRDTRIMIPLLPRSTRHAGSRAFVSAWPTRSAGHGRPSGSSRRDAWESTRRSHEPLLRRIEVPDEVSTAHNASSRGRRPRAQPVPA